MKMHYFFSALLMILHYSLAILNTNDNALSLLFLLMHQCLVLANQGIRATGFMCAQGMSNAQNRCTFKSTTNKSTFEYAFLTRL